MNSHRGRLWITGPTLPRLQSGSPSPGRPAGSHGLDGVTSTPPTPLPRRLARVGVAEPAARGAEHSVGFPPGPRPGRTSGEPAPRARGPRGDPPAAGDASGNDGIRPSPFPTGPTPTGPRRRRHCRDAARGSPPRRPAPSGAHRAEVQRTQYVDASPRAKACEARTSFSTTSLSASSRGA